MHPDSEELVQLLQQARRLLAPPATAIGEGSALCFDILARWPGCREAAGLVLEMCHFPDVIRKYRRAIGRDIEEWDDRPWQERRRLALSFRLMHGRPRPSPDDPQPADIGLLLTAGRQQLQQDYALADRRGGEMAWSIFQAAFKRTQQPEVAMDWVAGLYAHLGYFAEAVAVLEQRMRQHGDAVLTRRFWAEVCWWRDHERQIPWLPPPRPGHGRRYRQIMRQLKPDFVEAEAGSAAAYQPPDRTHLPPDLTLPPLISEALVTAVDNFMDALPASAPGPSSVDWSYLQKLETGNISLADFPAWAQYLLLAIEDPVQQTILKQRLLQQLSYGSAEDYHEGDEG